MFSITSTIEIDAGHRVPTHGSKCFSLHGHRYKIQATAIADEARVEQLDTQEAGMVMDFGFLKRFMMEEIDAYCDHAMILWVGDNVLDRFTFMTQKAIRSLKIEALSDIGFGFSPVNPADDEHKLLVVPFIPTAELLARFWFEALERRIFADYATTVRLKHIQVYETPNNIATYPVEG